MAKRGTMSPAIAVSLDHDSAIPLYRQLYEGLRQTILAGRLRSGTSLPSTRLLASALNVSRATVVLAFEQLLDEGYVQGKIGAGTYVANVLPDDHLYSVKNVSTPNVEHQPPRMLGKRGQAFADYQLYVAQAPIPRAFRPGIPALDAFPFAEWQRVRAAAFHNLQDSDFDYGHPAGYQPLRHAIVEYLTAARAVRCTAAQVVVVTGTHQALYLIAQLLLNPGDAVWIEDPVYPAARYGFENAQAELIPVPVDDEGLDVEAGIASCSAARLAYVTPSHQFPLGVTMSLARRLALLEWARRTGMWIVEDDYDSELRYTGRPLPSLQGLDDGDRVIYIGTFSKVLFPALRLGYMVLPNDLTETFIKAHAVIHGPSPTLEQATVATYIAEGYFERHIRRMRALYAERQQALIDDVERHLGERLVISPASAGMHLVGWLPAGTDDRAVSRRAAEYGIMTPPLSAFCIRATRAPALLLGYTGSDRTMIEDGVRQLSQAICAS